MTVLDALAILEDATSLCKQRDIYTPELREALNFLEQRVWPDWLIPRLRYHARLNGVDVNKEAKQQALRAILHRIRESVKDPLGKQRGYMY
jgi:hypothetical protein